MAGELGNALDAELVAEVVVIDVAGLRHRAVGIDRAVAVAVPAVEAPRRARDAEIAGAIDAGVGGEDAVVVAGEAHERLDDRAGRVAALECAVVHRPVRVFEQTLVLALADAARKEVGIETGLAHNRQHLARLRVNQHRGAAIVAQRAVNERLQFDVET